MDDARWRPFFRRQREERASRDLLASAVLLLILLIVAYRVRDQATPTDLLSHALLTALCMLAVLGASGSPSYLRWRNFYAVCLRLGVCTSGMVSKHALRILQHPPPASRAAIHLSTFYMLLGDHAFLLAFIAVGWPVGSLSNIVLQLLSLMLVARDNHAICQSQFMRGATTASGLQALRPAFIADSPLLASFALKTAGPDREQVCMIYTFIVQAVAGFLLPAYFFLCHCSRSAVQHAEISGIPRENRLHRMYYGIHSVLCIHGNWVSRLSVLLVAMAGMWVVGCTLLPG